MSFLLGLDIGQRRTGVAFADTKADFIMSLDTIMHSTTEELVAIVADIVKKKRIDLLVIGLPRLPQGEEGKQAQFVRSVAKELIQSTGLSVKFIDERYSSETPKGSSVDSDAKAACEVVSVAMEQMKNDY